MLHILNYIIQSKLCIILLSDLGSLLNDYLLRRTLIKYFLNFKCHKNCHAHCIRCKDHILFTYKKSNSTYFELHNFKLSYILSLYPLRALVEWLSI
jgi:hypothetical protein